MQRRFSHFINESQIHSHYKLDRTPLLQLLHASFNGLACPRLHLFPDILRYEKYYRGNLASHKGYPFWEKFKLSYFRYKIRSVQKLKKKNTSHFKSFNRCETLAFSELQMEKWSIQKDFWYPSSHRFSQFLEHLILKGLKIVRWMLLKAIKKQQAAESSTFFYFFCLISKILHLSNLGPSSSLKVLHFNWCCLVKLQFYGPTTWITIFLVSDYKTAGSYLFTKFLTQSEQKYYIVFSQIKQVWK